MRSTSSTAPYPAWIGVALVFYTFIAIGIAEGGLGVLLPSILQTYHLTPGTVTLLFLSQVSGYMIAAFTNSLLSSWVGLARLLLLAATLLTSALCIYAATTHWWVMVVAGMCLGLACGLIDAGGNIYIANDQKNANLMGMLHAFYGIGALLGPTIATTLLAFEIGWRQIYQVIACVVGVAIAGMLWAVLHRYPPMTRRAIAATDARSDLRRALKTPSVLVAGLLLLVYVGTEVAIGNWAYTVQTVSRHTPNWIAGYSISGYWLGLTLGRLGMGQMVKYLGAVRLINFSLMLLVTSLLIWWLLPNSWLTLPLIGFALSTIFPAMIWLTPKRVPLAIVPAAIGFLASAGSLGAAAIPAMLGWFADRQGLEIIPVLMLPLAAALVILHRWLVQYAPLKTD